MAPFPSFPARHDSLHVITQCGSPEPDCDDSANSASSSTNTSPRHSMTSSSNSKPNSISNSSSNSNLSSPTRHQIKSFSGSFLAGLGRLRSPRKSIEVDREPNPINSEDFGPVDLQSDCWSLGPYIRPPLLISAELGPSPPIPSPQSAGLVSPTCANSPISPSRAVSAINLLSSSPFFYGNMIHSPSPLSPSGRSPGTRRSFSELFIPFASLSRRQSSSHQPTSSSKSSIRSSRSSSDLTSPSTLNASSSIPVVVETSTLAKEVDSVTGRKVINQYLIVRELGRGCHGKVKLCRNIETGEQVAIKIVEKQAKRRFGNRLSMSHRLAHARAQQQQTSSSSASSFSPTNPYYDKIKKEIAILKKCNHTHVVKLKEVIDDPAAEKIYLVLEYLAGGEVLWHDSSDPPRPVRSPDEARCIFRDLISGAEYLHYQGILHRDIKPANLLWTHDKDHIKISDFGVSCYIGRRQPSRQGTEEDVHAFGSISTESTGSNEDLSDALDVDNEIELAKTAGSPAFFAPEVCAVGDDDRYYKPVDGKRDPVLIGKAIDIWAMGVTLFCLVFGRVPFMADTEFELFHVICKTAFQYPNDLDIPISSALNDLFEKLFDKNPLTRISLFDLKRHKWVTADMSALERETWLAETDPRLLAPVCVTDEEVKSAISFMGRIRTQMRKLSTSISNLWAGRKDGQSPSSPTGFQQHQLRRSADGKQRGIGLSREMVGSGTDTDLVDGKFSASHRRTRSLPSVSVADLQYIDQEQIPTPEMAVSPHYRHFQHPRRQHSSIRHRKHASLGSVDPEIFINTSTNLPATSSSTIHVSSSGTGTGNGYTGGSSTPTTSVNGSSSAHFPSRVSAFFHSGNASAGGSCMEMDPVEEETAALGLSGRSNESRQAEVGLEESVDDVIVDNEEISEEEEEEVEEVDEDFAKMEKDLILGWQ